MQSSLLNILMSLSLCHNMMTSWFRSFCRASCISRSQFEPGKTTMPNFINTLFLQSYDLHSAQPITEINGISKNYPVKYNGKYSPIRIIICSGMKQRKGHKAKHPVNIVNSTIYKD